MADIYRHKRTRREYKILVFDTSVRTSYESFIGIVYYLIADPMQIFCRSKEDFAQKYEKVEKSQQLQKDIFREG